MAVYWLMYFMFNGITTQAARYNDAAESAEVEPFKWSWVDCSKYQEPEPWMEVRHEDDSADAWWITTNIEVKSEKEAWKCNHFIYDPVNNQITGLRFGQIHNMTHYFLPRCVARGDFDDMNQNMQAQVCKPIKKDKVWTYARMVTRERCAQRLCSLAKTGEWKNGWFKQNEARKTPWKAKLKANGHKSLGYEEAFEECNRGPEEFRKLGDLLGSFEDLAKDFGLVSKVCGCLTATYIGGSANLAEVAWDTALAKDAQGMLACLAAADVVLMCFYFAALMLVP
eukprot:Skav205753  [mRNA]  locus=scaffold1714:7227:8681:- [translate_table: standard]